MSLPFDLEDVIGVAAAELVKRFLGMWSCLVIGWLLAVVAALGMVLSYQVWSVVTGGGWSGLGGSIDAGDFALGMFFGFFGPLMTSFGVLYGTFLIGLAFYFFKADVPNPYVWGGAIVVVGLSMGVSYHEDFSLLEGVIAGVIWIVEMLGVFFFLKLWQVRKRVEAERHLMTIAQENLMRREEIRQRTGGAVADREFAVGEESCD